jgi:hypothetical protein
MNGQSDIAVWILGGVVSILGTALWWSIKVWIKGINEKFDSILTKLTSIEKQNVGFEKDISHLALQINSHDKRLHDHGERIRSLEVNSNK